MAENKSKVKLVGKDNQIIFVVTPSSMSEGRTANYDQWNLVHLPTDLYAYRNTTSRTWDITALLVSRTPKEAAANAKILNNVRTWVLPDFAATGAPPEILKFTAYDDPNIDKVTCILRNYSWQYPTDVDYVFDPENPRAHKMPIIGTLGISLMEVYSATEIQQRGWKIKETGSDTINNPKGFGKMPPEFSNSSSKGPLGSSPLLPDIPGIPDVTGDLGNFMNDISFPSINDVVKDAISNLPSLPLPSLPNGFSSETPSAIEPGDW